MPVLKGGSIPKRDLFWHYPHYGNQGGEPSAIIISGNKKLIHYYEDGRNELYDIAKDVGEQNNITKEHPELSAELKKKLDAWLKETGAIIPKKDERFDPKRKQAQIQSFKERKKKTLEKSSSKYFK